MSDALMQIEDLSVGYAVQCGTLQALRHVSLTVRAGEVLGIMGESGCGKSTLAAAMINLLAANARVTTGAVRYRGRDILTLVPEEQRRLRGRHIAMVFQDPMTAFNPVLTIGAQLIDYQHNSAATGDRKARALAMLEKVGIADAARCLRLYPHELSGGMRQRVAIAAALMMQPDVLVADEPTTALDVTMEAQVIHLLRALQQDFQGAIVVVTHHLGVIAELCDRVAVMYAGEVVEEGLVDDIFHAPRHPYTAALIACDPATLMAGAGPLPTIGGRLPDLRTPPAACAFAPRCPRAQDICNHTPPPRVTLPSGHTALCHMVTA
jgi:oligopeptide/dipeptide ABC transporter ATP-binding protein